MLPCKGRQQCQGTPHGGWAHSILVDKSYNLHRIDMSLHAATHLDAPLHFIREGADIAATDLTLYTGLCYVLPAEAVDALRNAPPRLLQRGEPRLTPARVEKLLSLSPTGTISPARPCRSGG